MERLSVKGPGWALFSTVGSAAILGQSLLNTSLFTIGAFLAPFLPVFAALGNVFFDLQGLMPMMAQLPAQLGGLFGEGLVQPAAQEAARVAPEVGFFWTG